MWATTKCVSSCPTDSGPSYCAVLEVLTPKPYKGIKRKGNCGPIYLRKHM